MDAGLTQQELARLVGVSQAHIAKIENAKVDPRLSTVNKILQVLVEGEGRICRDIMTRTVISASPSDRILKISDVMMRNAISQLPVMYENKIVGTVTEQTIIKNLHNNIGDRIAEELMDPPLPCVPETSRVNTIRSLLEEHPGVLISQKDEIVGIVTRSDLLKTVSNSLR